MNRTVWLVCWLCWCGRVAGVVAAEVVIEPGASGTVPTLALDRHPVEPKGRYLIEWMMKVEGEKRWRFRAEFAGVIATFKGEGEAPAGEIRRHTSCYTTQGWQPAWQEVE